VRSNVEKRLAEVRGESVALRESLRVLEEQVAYQQGLAEDAETRAVVASTPLADRARREAADDAHRTRRQRDETASRLTELMSEQDMLLERLFAESTGTSR
jgi:glutathione S-transferase